MEYCIDHVLLFFAYALLGVAVVIAWWKLAYDLVYISLAFLTIGMLFGALWAKEAWGHYWSWDPKETWAAITWIAYLVYIHYRLMSKAKSQQPGAKRLAFWMLITSFVLLQMCWWGINYLPSAQGSSVHTYSTSE
jgi:ABC-type transport system involved in cytochrome c biogenesis permease subunit